jgi:hypothetical protein
MSPEKLMALLCEAIAQPPRHSRLIGLINYDRFGVYTWSRFNRDTSEWTVPLKDSTWVLTIREMKYGIVQNVPSGDKFMAESDGLTLRRVAGPIHHSDLLDGPSIQDYLDNQPYSDGHTKAIWLEKEPWIWAEETP